MTTTSPTTWPHTVSIVVPTYNERDTIGPLISRLDALLPPERSEILVVDDSSDDTPEIVSAAAETARVPVRLLHRSPDERSGGLGGAVLLGLRASTGSWVVVMDGDLQHPPETVPDLLAATAHADAVVASRYRAGGSASGLDGGWRRSISSGAGSLAKLLFPGALRGCTDPMSGFFAVRRAVLEGVDLQPDGFKILLEILARARGLRIQEVPFTFADRPAGESKASARQGFVYLRHLARLRAVGRAGQIGGFLGIGASGLVVNLAAVWALQKLGLHYLVTTVVATLIAMTWNFVLTDFGLFRHRRSGRLHHRYAGFLGLNALDVLLRVPLMAVLVGRLGIGVLSATALCVVVVSVLRFAALDRFVYRLPVPLPGARPGERPVPVPVPTPEVSDAAA